MCSHTPPQKNKKRRKKLPASAFGYPDFLESKLYAQTAQSVILGVIGPNKTGVREKGRVIDEAPLNAGSRIPGPLDDWIELPSSTAEDVRGHARIANRETADQVTAHIVDEMPPAGAFGIGVSLNADVAMEIITNSRTRA